MKSTGKSSKIIIIILTLALVFTLGCYTENIRASNTLQSKGKIVYKNPETGEEVIIDTADHEVLKEDIDAVAIIAEENSEKISSNTANINKNTNSITTNSSKILSFEEFIEEKNSKDSQQDSNISALTTSIDNLNTTVNTLSDSVNGVGTYITGSQLGTKTTDGAGTDVIISQITLPQGKWLIYGEVKFNVNSSGVASELVCQVHGAVVGSCSGTNLVSTHPITVNGLNFKNVTSTTTMNLTAETWGSSAAISCQKFFAVKIEN